jgi:hypothetical protein
MMKISGSNFCNRAKSAGAFAARSDENGKEGSMSDPRVRIRTAEPADLDSLVSLLTALFSIEEDFVCDEP